MMDERGYLVDIFNAALKGVDPYCAVMRLKEAVLEVYENGRYTSLYVIGFGKAVHGMVRATMDAMGDKVTAGIAITKYGLWAGEGTNGRIRIFEAGHPLPDENGVRATMKAVTLARSLGTRSMLLCLVSGGGSALLVAPAAGILLADKQRTTDLLSKAGADIHELNTVRKHVSDVKGGRLAEIAFPAGVMSLVLSDVIDDRLDVIASGPTAPDETTYAGAIGVIEKYEIQDAVPRNVYEHLMKGKEGRLTETPKKGDPAFVGVRNKIVGSNKQAMEAARKRCEELGLDAVMVDGVIRGEARDAGRWLAIKARKIQKGRTGARKGLCLISGGETTVTVRGRGAGGRNMELALAAALEMEGIDNITLLSAGTDGTDGPTDAAGAIVDGHSVAKGRAKGIDPEASLLDNDSYRFFQHSGDLFVSGPTGTNVMDIQLILMRP